MAAEPRPLLAAAWMVGAIIAFSSMAVGGRAVASELDSFELMMYRSYIGFVVMLIVGVVFGKFGEIRFDNMALHGLRNMGHFIGQNLWFTALPLITLAQLFALEFTSPIWVVIFAVLFAGEKVTQTRIMAVFFGFIGALVVARPGFGGDIFGLSLAAASAIGFAVSIVSTRVLTRTETIFGILFWLTAMQAVFGTITTLWDGDIAWPSLAIWPWVVLVGFAGLIAHACLTNALAVAPATIVTPMDFARLPAAALIGMLFYSEAIDIWVFVGALIIFGGNYLNIWSQTKRA